MLNISKIYRTFIGTFALCAVASCDSIDKDERYITAMIPDVGRKVLVEEFTGQFCVNCPDGHAMLKNIMNVYGENVVAVSIHAGSLASDIEGYGLKTPEGDTYAGAFGVQAYPSIVVNRQGAAVTNMPQWQDAVQKVMGQSTSVDISLNANISSETGKLNIDAVLTSNAKITAMCQVWITESGIVTFQQEQSGLTADYVHNHVYRSAVNGVGGEQVVLTPEESESLSYSVDLNKGWNTDNLSVIAFVYDKNGVMQVEEINVNK